MLSVLQRGTDRDDRAASAQRSELPTVYLEESVLVKVTDVTSAILTVDTRRTG